MVTLNYTSLLLVFPSVLNFPLLNSNQLFTTGIHTVSVLGTLHNHRNRWNPFHIENVMQREGNSRVWMRWFNLHSKGGRHQDGIYNLRFIINYNPRRTLKLIEWNVSPELLIASLRESSLGDTGGNLTLHVLQSCSVCVRVDPEAGEASFTSDTPASLSPIAQAVSFQLNGFVWDDVDMFLKFDERAPCRSFRRVAENFWELAVPLRRDGGIDFRRDGVYQFLISCNGDEDQGLSALNRPTTAHDLHLIEGSGFGSSHGTARHSAPTIKVEKNCLYIFSLKKEPQGYRLWIRDSDGYNVPFLNHSSLSIQLLGTIFSEHGFDPSHPQATMQPDASGMAFETCLSIGPGAYSINFAIAHELFLDTMGLGCWLEYDGYGLRGIAWHGKPNEVNIGFHVRKAGHYRFRYDCSCDQFTIEPVAPEHQKPGILEPILGIETLSLVGSFAPPLESWSTDSANNIMACLGGCRFEKLVYLESSCSYEFKFVANRSNWHIVFADYELDGYGMSYESPINPSPFDSRLCDLRRYGQLTTHGNPPPIRYRPKQTGMHRFCVDLNTGAYSVQPALAPVGCPSSPE
ncbi:hypothetical protein [Cyanobium sp. CH-040]|uniref:hypothetical protein n=1 Tax=Cyanobium sp. CH-040 TaxID=2823708 RepID=UPI0020CF75A7|nr:hypothetical protein [Cyanobium sp. CH-040]MCP9927033.1 hypothetical protein [Cyanobium sp. CH-040]